MKSYLNQITSSPLFWKLRPKGLFCFNYHRIGEPTKDLFDPNVFSCNEGVFAEHLKFYKSNFDIITIGELNAVSNTKKRLNEKFALITFDDDYIDNYSLAYPLLKANGVPAVFFIATDFIEKDIIPCWDEIAYLLQFSNKKSVTLDNWESPVSLSSPKGKYVKYVLQRIQLDSSKSIDE
jgi:hypothetical protein